MTKREITIDHVITAQKLAANSYDDAVYYLNAFNKSVLLGGSYRTKELRDMCERAQWIASMDYARARELLNSI